MSSYVNIQGGKELAAFLQALPLKVERNIMRSALRAGAGVIAKEAKQNVPVQNGELRKSIRTSSNAKKGKVEATVKVGSKKAWYSRFVEFGTAPHMIRAGKNKPNLVFFGKSGKRVVTQQVAHPGARPRPFMRPAFDTKGDEAVGAVAKRIRERLTKENINVVAPEVDSI